MFHNDKLFVAACRESSLLQQHQAALFICCPRVSINRVSINIPSLCIYILSTKPKVIFCQQQQTTDHPFNDCSFILRSIEAPVVTLRHANEADCDNERWPVTTHRMPGVTPGTGRWAGRQRDDHLLLLSSVDLLYLPVNSISYASSTPLLHKSSIVFENHTLI